MDPIFQFRNDDFDLDSQIEADERGVHDDRVKNVSIEIIKSLIKKLVNNDMGDGRMRHGINESVESFQNFSLGVSNINRIIFFSGSAPFSVYFFRNE